MLGLLGRPFGRRRNSTPVLVSVQETSGDGLASDGLLNAGLDGGWLPQNSS
jgi:hypothetical protein